MSNVEKTKKYVKLPPPQAVPFSGFDFAKIPSREPVEDELETYIKRTKEANYFTTSLIIAEWGEGKTDAFNRYIKPKTEKNKDVSYLVSTSTIVNKISNVDKIIPSAPPESISLMACVLYALKDELSLSGAQSNLFHEYNSLTDPNQYLVDVLKSHKNEKIYVFIDEFEEILNQNNEVQKKFLSGLKELLNGQISSIGEGGVFEGKIHFIIACTPYAFNRLRSDVDLQQIFGALDSRLSSNRIRLPQIKRDEAMQFLLDLLLYCYNDKIPEIYPIRSSGILNTIVTISQKNLRSLVQLLSDLLVASVDNGQANVIDSELLIKTYIDKTISVYGSSTERIDKELLLKIYDYISNLSNSGDYKKILDLMIGESKSYSILDVEKITGVRNIHNRINEINMELRKIGLPKTICELNEIKDNVSINDLLDILNPSNNLITLGESKRIHVDDFKEVFIDYSFNESYELTQRAFLPHNKEDLCKILDISEYDAELLIQKIARYFKSTASERCYRISKDLLDQLFPSPLVLQLDHIVDRNKRMDLWRDSLRNFLNYDEEFKQGMLDVINEDINIKVSQRNGDGTLIYTDGTGHEFYMSAYVDARTSKITMNDVYDIKRKINETNSKIYLLFYSGELDQTVINELNNIPKLLAISLRPIRVQQLIATKLAEKKAIRVNHNILSNRLREMLFEIDFSKLFSEWLSRVKKIGLLVEDLNRPLGETESSIIHALTYFIQTVDVESSIQDVFDTSIKLQSFTVFRRGRRASFAPLDVEKIDSLEKYLAVLQLNDFIDIKNQKITIGKTSIETQILNILQNKPLSKEALKERFIILSKNETLFEDVYLTILENKGLISNTNNKYEVIDRASFEMMVRSKVGDHLRSFEEWVGDDWSYAHICTAKDRGDKVIHIEEFNKYVVKLLSKLEKDASIKYDDDHSLRLIKLLNTLIDHYGNELKEYVMKSKQYSREVIKNVEEENEKIINNLNSILSLYNKYTNGDYKITDILEYINYVRLYNSFNDVIIKKYDKDELMKGMEYVRSTNDLNLKIKGVTHYYHFERTFEDASQFNYKIYELELKSRAVNNKIVELNEILGDINEKVVNIVNVNSAIKSKVIKYDIKDEYIFSKLFLEKISNYSFKTIDEAKYDFLNLSDMTNYFTSYNDSLSSFQNNLVVTTSKLESLIEFEKRVQASKTIIGHNIEVMKMFFDIKGDYYRSAIAIDYDFDQKWRNYLDKEKQYLKSMNDSTNILILINHGNIAENYLKDLINYVNDSNDEINALYTKAKNELNSTKEDISIFIDIIAKIGVSVESIYETFCQSIDDYTNLIDAIPLQDEIALTWTEISNDVENRKNAFLVQIEKHLSKEEYSTLLAIISLSAESRWNEMNELNDQLVEMLDLSKDEIIKNVRYLIDKELLQVGVKIPI